MEDLPDKAIYGVMKLLLVIDNLEYTTTHRYLIPAIEKNPDKFTLVHSLKNPDTWLLEF